MSEFSLIDRYFSQATHLRTDVIAGIGDDAAILQLADGQQLVAATDTLVAGVHFPEQTPADAIGHKALAVNLSDLAAMGATPAWALLALTLPGEDPQWLAGFVEGFSGLAQQFDLSLVGGDTTRGPLTITVQLLGYLPAGSALTRSGAKPGDRIFVTGKLGDAALGLRAVQSPPGANISSEQAESMKTLVKRLNYPQPRVAAGQAIRALASSAIDISDGLLADLGHILAASGVGARLPRHQLPRSESFITFSEIADADPESAWNRVLSGGDDYELCFTIAEDRAAALLALDWSSCNGITEVGSITAGNRLEVIDESGELLPRIGEQAQGYDHFSS